QDVVPGSTVVLKSAYSGTAPFKVKWFKGETEITTGGTRFIKKETSASTLELHSVKPSDSAEYACEVSNDKCQMAFTGSAATLNLSNCSLDDSGSFVCMASNEAGSDRCSCVVTVKGTFNTAAMTVDLPLFSEPANIVEPAKSISVTVGDPATFECRLSGSKVLLPKWSKNGKELTSGKKYKLQCTDKSSVLKILSTEKNDSGEYFFEVSNDVGRATCEAVLTVLGLFILPFS
uniref:Ig-like domain-containing protein n=1 Tax=Denticeps clupeoides TaxID=299321 RepID=A0AAY4EXA8_9TELE